MSEAQCACGALRLNITGAAKLVAVCHCFSCQRRTGSPFSVNAFFAVDEVEVSGISKQFDRIADSGRTVRMYFCPECGSTLYWKPDAEPSIVGVAVGAFADPEFAAPTLSVFEKTKHEWAILPEQIEHYAETIPPENTPNFS